MTPLQPATDNLFPSFYLGPISYYVCLIKHDLPVFDSHEHFIKQTYRNRCVISTANGPIPLTLPVKKGNSKTSMGSIRLDFTENHIRKHKQALTAAYGSSPFFEFYDYLFFSVYDNPPEKLIDWNTSLHRVVMQCLQLSEASSTSTDFKLYGEPDNRTYFNAKQGNPVGQLLPTYYQTFADRIGFIPDLSIVDLIFHLGPEASEYLRKIPV
jgi:hypothetical protein